MGRADPRYSLTIVEGQPMRQDVVVDAAAMGKDITATGKVIIYGILPGRLQRQ